LAALTSQGGRFVQATIPPGVINLGLGQPSPRLLPLAEICRAAQAQLGGGDPLVLQYGAALGDPEFRRSLARWLSDEYQHPVTAEQLMVTGGTSSALTFVSQTFSAPGATVVSEDPTYFLAHGVFQSAGLGVRGVPIDTGIDTGGLDLEALQRLLASGVHPAFVYVIPAFQNPTGACLQPERARELVELADRHDFLILADEPYVPLHYLAISDILDDPDRRPGSMMRYDEGRGRVLSLGSFSKLLGPGLRLGWAHGEPKLIERLSMHGALRSGGCFNPVVANIVQHTIDSGFLTTHVEQLREVFGARALALTAALHEHVPSARFVPPSGGYFCWVDLGAGVDSEALLERALDLRFIPGRRCAVGRELDRFVRLSFSFYEDHELVEGVRRLARLLETV
jgi:2-aminoadipate transaminase